MNLQQLERLFAPHTAQSSRILVDGNGVSRGVGFVRVRSRQAAQEVIDRLNGMVSLDFWNLIRNQGKVCSVTLGLGSLNR